MATFDHLKKLIAELEVDAEKFYSKGNSAAGTRLRKGLQEIKSAAQAMRIEIQSKKNTR
jgi:hypothetical protein